MPQQNVALQAFNRGLISKLGLARTDISRSAFSASIQTNWMPRVLGSMMLRPGFGYISTTYSSAKARYHLFNFAENDTALLEFTDSIMRVLVNDAPITRPSVSTTITNGNMSSSGSWSDVDETGAVSTFTGGNMVLLGTGFNAARRRQTVSLGTGAANVLHALRIVIDRGPVQLKVGSTAGGQEYVNETTLRTGTHSIAFTPTGTFYVEFFSRTERASRVDSCEIEAAGTLTLPTPWDVDDLPYIRKDQSADVLFVACRGMQQRRIERRNNGSWSVVLYEPEDGPFRSPNLTPITISASDTSGDVTLTASSDLFMDSHVGALFSIDSAGQLVTASLAGSAQFSDHIRVTGVGNARFFDVTRAGTWSGTLTLQRSFGTPGAWTDWKTFTTNGTAADQDDNQDNQIVYYRIGFKSGEYTSGTANVTITYSGGTLTGVAKITAVSSSTSASAGVIKSLGGTAASSNWREGEWSDFRGWPSAVCLYEGRLWWQGKDKNIGSVSDAFESFDPATVGDSGPISRSIGFGAVDTISWSLPLQRLLMGGQSAEYSVRSSSFDEPLTPTNYNLKKASTQGSVAIQAVAIDSLGYFVQKGGTRVFEMEFASGANYTYDYTSTDMTLLTPEVCAAGVVAMDVQRQPDTRLHCVLSDGTVAVSILDRAENVRCWIKIQCDAGDIVDVVVAPGGSSSDEDAVYYEIKRPDGTYHLCKWALESECQGGTLNKQADMFVIRSNTSTVAGLTHLEGEEVVAWGDGRYLGTFTVESGAIDLGETLTSVVVGMGYMAQYKSTKLAYAAAGGTALTQKKRIPQLGLILYNTHAQGLKYGQSFDDELDGLPLVEDGADVDQDRIWEEYDKEMFELPGQWDTDVRLCLQAQAPLPCTVLAAVLTVDTSG